jgi:hypothetical protein
MLNLKDLNCAATDRVEMLEKLKVLSLEEKVVAIRFRTGSVLAHNLDVTDYPWGWSPSWVTGDYGKTFNSTEVQTGHQLKELSATWRKSRLCRLMRSD